MIYDDEADAIVDEMAELFGVTPDQVRSRTKTRPIVDARQASMYLMRKRSPMTLKQIGEYFGRDHTTVLYAVRVVENRKEVYKSWEQVKI